MNTQRIFKVLNPLLGISLVVQAVTGVVLAFNWFSFQSEVFSQVHEYNGFLFVGLALAHVALNWNWVKATFFKKPAK